MSTPSPSPFLGAQVWLEPDDDAARIDRLFSGAAQARLGWARLFLLWPAIEHAPGSWSFSAWDAAFDAAARHGLRIKATLTANSGPWHIGTPSLLHSHTSTLTAAQRGPMRDYIRTCVGRYRAHPALGQWILWNEPGCGGWIPLPETDETRPAWGRFLHGRYDGDLRSLNSEWRAGFTSFDDAPFPAALVHPAQRDGKAFHSWESFRPWLDFAAFRAAWLAREIRWVADEVRRHDAATPLCINPSGIVGNVAQAGTDLEALGAIVDTVGASYHPPWQFTFAHRDDFPGLMVAGLRHQRTIPTVRDVEVTEVQSGNTWQSGSVPSAVDAGEIARFFAAPILAGASSVTGWCLNVRCRDNESGDWALLDDDDRPTARSQALGRLGNALDEAARRTGGWDPRPASARVLIHTPAQAIEDIQSRCAPELPGRRSGDGATGAFLLATLLGELGVPADVTRLRDVAAGRVPPAPLLVGSHLLCWEAGDARALLDAASAGACVILDALSGRSDDLDRLHRPWPGTLGPALDLRVAEMESAPGGHAVLLHGAPAGIWPLGRARIEVSSAWAGWTHLRYAADGAPALWERPFGKGRFLFATGHLGPAILHDRSARASVLAILDDASRGITARDPFRLLGTAGAFAQTAVGRNGTPFTLLCAPGPHHRSGRPLHLRGPAGTYDDLWSGASITVPASGEVPVLLPDGIALLLPRAG